jgi:hypothetical protein
MKPTEKAKLEAYEEMERVIHAIMLVNNSSKGHKVACETILKSIARRKRLLQ